MLKALLAAGIITTTLVTAATPEEEGYALTKVYHDMGRHFGNYLLNSRLTIISPDGKDTLRRELKIAVLERGDDSDYSIAQAQNPPEVRGTSFMTHFDPRGDHQQWIYLPDLRRVKKISSQSRSTSYFGSEFAYEDITSLTLGQYTFKKIGEKTLDGKEYNVIDRRPLYKGSGYGKMIVYMNKQSNLIERVEFYDLKGTLFKSMTITDWQCEGGTWFSGVMTMTNLINGRKSILDNYHRRLKVGLQEGDFTESSMQRLIKM